MDDQGRTRQDLLDRRVLKLFSKIRTETLTELRDGLLKLDTESSDDITLLIDCTGGDAPCAMQLHAVIKMLRAPVRGIVLGECCSGALIVLQACAKRIAAANAVFLVHSGSAGRTFRIDESMRTAVDAWIDERQRQEAWLHRILLSRSKLTAEKLSELVRNGDAFEVTFGSDRALEFGLVDAVTNDEFKLFCS